MAINIDGDGLIALGGTSTTQGRLRLAEDTDNGTNFVALQAPAAIASDVTFTLPAADGTANQVLKTDGSGNLGFASAGKVLQVVQAISNTTNKTTTSTSYVTAVTNASITPSSASNEIYIQWCGHCDVVANGNLLITILRGATDLGIGNGADACLSRMHDVAAGRFLVNQNFNLLDSPNTTSSITYTIHFRSADGVEVRIRDDIQRSRLVLMEIAA